MKRKPELPRPGASRATYIRKTYADGGERATPYRMGRNAACARQAAYETYNAFPPDRCPFKKGTPEEAEYDRGWEAQMKAFDKLA